MYAQLGDIVFNTKNGFTSFSVDGDEANFAEFELINSKPRLQKVGDTLQEINIYIKLHAKYINIEGTILSLKTYKSNGEILPFLRGDGKYLGDFVITSMPFTVDEAFADGTIIEANLSLTLKEYISFNKLDQQKGAARKKAFAIGDKKSILLRNLPPLSIIQSASIDITSAKLQTLKTDGLVTDIVNNPSTKTITAARLKETALKAKKHLSDLNKKIEDNQSLFESFPGIKERSQDVMGRFDDLLAAYPFPDVTKVQDINLNLQSNIRKFTKVSTPFLQKLITRHA